MTCNNSALNPNICVQGVGGVGSKIAITVVQNNHGFSAGTAVRWNSGIDGTTAEYRAAQANNAYNAEVVGIVSQKLDANSFELCTSGVVKMNDFFSNTTGSINEGATADDVYFLGGYTAGWLDNRRPTTPGWVAKPVITRIAENSDGDIFGSVTNYVGSLLGGSVAVSLGEIVPAGVVHAFAGSADKVPTGWAYCNGDGYVDQFGVPGINVTTYPFYYETVGKRYGWVECLKVDSAGIVVGQRIQQDVENNTKSIDGLVVGISGGVENGGKYIFVEQSIRTNTDNTNQNFETVEEFDSNTQGENSVAQFVRPVGVLSEFEQGNATIVGGPAIQILSDTSSKTGVFTALTPDMRERVPLGDSSSDLRGRVGGDGRNVIVSQGESQGLLSGQSGFTHLSNLQPYVSMNYIIRVDPSASAAIIDTLEIKNLRLTNLPTTGSGSVTNTVFQDSGTLKIVT
tara:strand:+ start:2560 stop:3927 length:1368 start_codon:yes stop_codon:yes gene_type:complete